MSDVIVIDDFYANPDAVRELALSLDFENDSTPNYPGFQSEIPCLSPAIVNKLEQHTLSKIDVQNDKDQMGFFRVIFERGESRLKVHADGMDWSVVIYLTPDCPEEIGTRLYRHKKTGLLGPPDDEGMKAMGYDSRKAFDKAVVVPDSLDETAWDVVDFIPFKYNRCLLFRASRRFHAHARGYGDSFETARLTQNFFFNDKVDL